MPLSARNASPSPPICAAALRLSGNLVCKLGIDEAKRAQHAREIGAGDLERARRVWIDSLLASDNAAEIDRCAGKRRGDMRVEAIERTLRGAIERGRAQLFAREGREAQLPQQRARFGRLGAERHIKALALRRRGGRNKLRRAGHARGVEAGEIATRCTRIALDREYQMHRREFGTMRRNEICFRTWRETRGECCDGADMLGVKLQCQFASARTPMTARGRIRAVEATDIETLEL